MNNLIMRLGDGTEIGISSFVLPINIVIHNQTKEEALETWALLTPDRLEQVQIMQNDVVLFAFSKAVLTGVQHVLSADGSDTVHFYMEGEIEPLGNFAEAENLVINADESMLLS